MSKDKARTAPKHQPELFGNSSQLAQFKESVKLRFMPQIVYHMKQ